MTNDRYFVTGGNGCLGAWVLRNLVRSGIPAAAFDLGNNHHRLDLIMSEEECELVTFIQGDVTDQALIEAAVRDFGATQIIHLAALQIPFVRADPVRGALVNVVGTMAVFEAAKKAGIPRVVYASSTAVYGLAGEYPEEPLPNDAPFKPRSHYGVFKVANEGSARVYRMDDGISSIGLRPYVIYGPGRDQGMTSGPTKAMLAAVLGQPYHIAHGGRFCMQYADDAARLFIAATTAPFQGAGAYNIGGPSASVPEIIQAIESVEPDAAGRITYEDVPLPFPPEVDASALLDVIDPFEFTPLKEGVAETMQIFRSKRNDPRAELSLS